MSGYLSVKNWETFQHYRDRNPPWIKLHRDLLRDYKFSCLPNASKLHLMLIWLLASQLDNRIPNDPRWIAEQLPVKGRVDLKPLIQNGFLVASETLADCQQSAMLETEAENRGKDKERDRGEREKNKKHAAPVGAGAQSAPMENREKRHDDRGEFWKIAERIGIPRALVGKELKGRSETEVVAAIVATAEKERADARAYFLACLKPDQNSDITVPDGLNLPEGMLK